MRNHCSLSPRCYKIYDIDMSMYIRYQMPLFDRNWEKLLLLSNPSKWSRPTKSPGPKANQLVRENDTRFLLKDWVASSIASFQLRIGSGSWLVTSYNASLRAQWHSWGGNSETDHWCRLSVYFLFWLPHELSLVPRGRTLVAISAEEIRCETFVFDMLPLEENQQITGCMRSEVRVYLNLIW